MKNIKQTLLVLVAVLSLVSCKKFLTVNPKTEMPQDKLFSTEGGFKDALTGAYIQMNDKNAYGFAMTMGTVENLASSWDVVANTAEQRIGLFNFDDEIVRNRLSDIFKMEYKVIASVNAILAQIDQKKSVFKTSGMYETIKSECLTIRAYCHMDMLRLFGPSPANVNVGNMLPYVKVLSNVPNPGLPYETFKTALLQDLAEAETLVKDIDPITQYSLDELRKPGPQSTFNPTDTYMAFRYLRLNYYAIKALQARAYLWFNDKSRAYESAKVVIEAKNKDGKPKFRLGTAADMSAKDYLLTCEHIFGLYDFKLYTKYMENFANGNLKKGSSATTINGQLYGNTGTDIREANLWQLVVQANSAKTYVLRKYLVPEKQDIYQPDLKQIPMLRISELYLIGMESASAGEAAALWNTFRISRNLPPAPFPADPLQLELALLKEYRKEFYGEGQGFFAYKRLNAPKTSFLFAPSAATINYLLPLPATESVNF